MSIFSRKKIQSSTHNQEGQKDDILIAGAVTSAAGVGNRYISYKSQVAKLYEMYANESIYGSEYAKAIIDLRLAFLSGSGISVMMKERNNQTEQVMDWIDSFLMYNKYYGSRFSDMVLTTELEGKALLTIKEDSENVKIKTISWKNRQYNVVSNDDEIKEIKYTNNLGKEEKLTDKKNFVYIKIGGVPYEFNDTSPRMAAVIQDMEDASRARYDIRTNNHLFARVTPAIKCVDDRQVAMITNKINAEKWVIGKAFVATADLLLTEPSGNAVEALMKEIIQCLKNISNVSGVPLQLLAYPELLSNRSTAENMLETVNASTNKEKMKIEEGVTEIIQKAMRMAVNRGWCKYYLPDSFTVKIDLTTFENLNQIIQTWLPLYMNDVIDMQTLRSMIPGIDPEEIKKIIDEENKKKAEHQNNIVMNQINQEMQEDEKEEGGDDSDKA